MSNIQNKLMFEESYLKKLIKHDYHGNKYSLFIGGLDPGTCEDKIVKKIESIGVADIIDVKIQRNEHLESKRYAEVHLFSTESVERIRENIVFTKMCIYILKGQDVILRRVTDIFKRC